MHRVAALLVMLPALSACASGDTGGGLCPGALELDGVTYNQLATQRHLPGGRPVGRAAYACTTPDAAGRKDARARFTARTIRGVDPEVAFVVPDEFPGYVFWNGPSNAQTHPRQVERLLR
jgi:hypothetical protein